MSKCDAEADFGWPLSLPSKWFMTYARTDSDVLRRQFSLVSSPIKMALATFCNVSVRVRIISWEMTLSFVFIGIGLRVRVFQLLASSDAVSFPFRPENAILWQICQRSKLIRAELKRIICLAHSRFARAPHTYTRCTASVLRRQCRRISIFFSELLSRSGCETNDTYQNRFDNIYVSAFGSVDCRINFACKPMANKHSFSIRQTTARAAVLESRRASTESHNLKI